MTYCLSGCTDYEIAQRAAKSVMASYGHDLCEDDYQDLVHEAYLEIAELRERDRATSKPNEYFFVAGRRAAKHWRLFWKYGAYRQKIRNARTGEYLDIVLQPYDGNTRPMNKPVNWVGYDEKSDFWASITDEKIRELLYKAKKRHGGVHNKALEEDLVILRELGEGKTNGQVAELVGKSENFIKSKRQMLKRILLRYAAENGIEVPK